MSEDLISIIVPVYNVERYLEKCINSIRNQTYSNIEIILVDDGSEDCSGRMCDEYAEQDKRIRVIHKENGGLASARNAGLIIARGDYIGFVDSDDWIERDMYEELHNACLRDKSDIACCGRKLWYGEKCQRVVYSLDNNEIWTPKETIERLLIWDAVDSSACDKLFKKNLFAFICFPEGKLHEDIFIMYKIIENAKQVSHIGNAKYYYRQRKGGITRNSYTSNKMDLLTAIDEMEVWIKKRYPDLAKRMQVFCIVNTDIVIYQFRQSKMNSKKYPSDLKKMDLEFRKYGKGCLRNPYLSIQEKIKYIFIVFHITNFYLWVKNLYLKYKV